MELIVKRGSGFIYYISREGVTWNANEYKILHHKLPKFARIRICPSPSGFGISNPEQAKLVAAEADTVSCSVIVNQIDALGKSPELVAKVGAFVRRLPLP